MSKDFIETFVTKVWKDRYIALELSLSNIKNLKRHISIIDSRIPGGVHADPYDSGWNDAIDAVLKNLK